MVPTMGHPSYTCLERPERGTVEGAFGAAAASVLGRNRLTGAVLAAAAVVGFAGLGVKALLAPGSRRGAGWVAGRRGSLEPSVAGPAGWFRHAIRNEEVRVVQSAGVVDIESHQWEAPSASSWIIDDGPDAQVDSPANSPTLRLSSTSATTAALSTIGTTAAPAVAHQHIKLFCFSVLRASSVEVELMQEVIKEKVGLAGCDDWAIVTDTQIRLSDSLGMPVNSLVIGTNLSTSQSGSFNVHEFGKAWDAIAADGAYKRADFVVKVDPDTVFFPNRLRDQLRKEDNLQAYPIFFANCMADVDWQAQEHAHFMYGPIEVFSQSAIVTYFRNADRCTSLQQASEDYEESFITRCLLKLDVVFNAGLGLQLLQDPHCQGGRSASPCIGGSVAFHSFSTVHDWFACWNEAYGPGDPTDVFGKRQG